MTLIETVKDLCAWRRKAGTVILVPTMGALHEGHAALIRDARALAGDEARVAVTIFVNPLQFGPNEDFARYPRTMETDLQTCADSGADMVFAPEAAEVYAADRSVTVCEANLSRVLCGASRPGHFDGVCTVVAKLFNLCQPDEALFGKKDYQQLAIIRRMVRDLNFPVTIHGMETVREADGLAMSSRNRYLTEAERVQAAALRAALLLAREAWRSGMHEARELINLIGRYLRQRAALAREDYIQVVDRQTLQPMDVVTEEGLIALAVFFDKARLIDNIELIRE